MAIPVSWKLTRNTCGRGRGLRQAGLWGGPCKRSLCWQCSTAKSRHGGAILVGKSRLRSQIPWQNEPRRGMNLGYKPTGLPPTLRKPGGLPSSQESGLGGTSWKTRQADRYGQPHKMHFACAKAQRTPSRNPARMAVLYSAAFWGNLAFSPRQ